MIAYLRKLAGFLTVDRLGGIENMLPEGTTFDKNNSAVLKFNNITLIISMPLKEFYMICIQLNGTDKNVRLSKDDITRFLKIADRDPNKIEKFIMAKKCACSNKDS